MKKFAEATALRESPENLARVKRQAELVGAEIRAGTFDYLKWFPHGNRAAEFLVANGLPVPEGKVVRPERWTVRRYYDQWIRRKVAPLVRVSAARDYRIHFRMHVLDVLGEVALADMSLAHLEDLRNGMRGRGLSEKTIRNVIDGSLRALVRDAGQDDIEAGFPFPKMRWPDKIVPGPSPFTADERDRLLEYFRVKHWKSGAREARLHYPYYAFLYTLFYTGMRPSEATALRLRTINLGAQMLQVERSRHLGAEAAPKTARARRTVRLMKGNVDVLEKLIELQAQPDDYVFKNVWGGPIIGRYFYELFRGAERALSLTPLRDLYSVKDTYISLALTNGVSLTWLSEQTGVAVSTMLKHYGRFIHSTQADAFEMSKMEPVAVQFGHRDGHRRLA